MKTALFLIFLTLALIKPSHAVILLESADSTFHTTTPGDNSGWQYEGQFGGFLGTPIAPFYFLSAAHVGGPSTFTFHGETYTTVASYADPTGSDLLLWQVDHPFPAYAPLFTASAGNENGRPLRVIGRGTERGSERLYGSDLRGWDWGAGTGVQRWGSNVVTDILAFGNEPVLRVAFDNPGVPGECHLSSGDSGGGMFIQENGLWKLAAINYGVDDLYTVPDNTGYIVSAVFDARGFYVREDNGSFTLLGGDTPVPTAFYGTRVAARLAWLQDTTGVNPNVLPTESYAAWSTLYFTPAERVAAATGGPAADPDRDGVPNLLEYAFNLDPTCPEPATLTAGTGLRGLPLIRVETLGAEQRLTVEFVRRTAASGAGLTYAAQFATDPAAANWQPGGTESVTPINARWERVKVTDSVAVGGSPRRFARVAVTQS